jgi:hypothetical protein
MKASWCSSQHQGGQAFRVFAVFHDHIPEREPPLLRIEPVGESESPRLDARGSFADRRKLVKIRVHFLKK